jgi:hypothetical protein
MKLENIVWTAVIALVMGVATIVSAVYGDMVYTTGFGLCAVTSALLSSRERR